MAGFLDLLAELKEEVMKHRELFEKQIYMGGSKNDGVENKLWYIQECCFMWTWYNACKFHWWEWPEMRADILRIAEKVYGKDSREYKKLDESLPHTKSEPRSY